MSLFGCDHKWNKWSKPHNGRKQRKCRKCGRLQSRKVSQFWCTHKYRGGKRTIKNNTVKCIKCNKPKKLTTRKEK